MPKLNVVFIPVQGSIRRGEIEFVFGDSMRNILEKAHAAGLGSNNWNDKRVFFDDQPVHPEDKTMTALVPEEVSALTIVEDEEPQTSKL